MKTLYERLLWICQDQDASIKTPRGADIARLLGCSSGRPTQIRNEGEAARLGEEYLRKMTKLGYSPDWVQEGIGDPKRPAVAELPKTLSKEERLAHVRAALISMLKAAGLNESDLMGVSHNVGLYTADRVHEAVKELAERTDRRINHFKPADLADMVVLTLRTWVERHAQKVVEPVSRENGHGNDN